MLHPTHPAGRPDIVNLVDSVAPRLQWYGQPGHQGGPWTADSALATTITDLEVHWSEVTTPAGQPDSYYLDQMAQEAQYHAFQRVWATNADGSPIHGDGLMYHYVIAPANECGRAIIYQVAPETKRTWNDFANNAFDLAICMMAGHGDTATLALINALESLLDWFTTARPDLPLVTAKPQTITLAGKTYQTHGVRTHDEGLLAQGRPPKGCCGCYIPVVQAWRTRQP